MSQAFRNFGSRAKRFSATLVSALYPPLCLACGEELSEDGFCARCWSETQFILGTVCDSCGTPLLGEKLKEAIHCDSCLKQPAEWQRGRAAALYDGGAAKVIMSLKYADRWDLAGPLADYMITAGRDVLVADIVVPVPLHWRRLISRKYNQAALLSGKISQRESLLHIPDLLVRKKRTVVQKGMDRDTRFENQTEAIGINRKYEDLIAGKRILLVDDVMTTGATLSACALALKNAGSGDVNILVFARVAKPL